MQIHRRFGVLGRFVVGLSVLLGSTAAQAVVVYQFSLPANGEVGALTIRLTVDDFIGAGEFEVFDLVAPEVDFSSGTPLDASGSVAGFQFEDAETAIGLALVHRETGLFVLLTRVLPDDFFTFSRAVDEEGVFMSTGGLVESDSAIETSEPTATLCVSSIGACSFAVGEPGSLGWLGFALLGFWIVGRERRGVRSAS